MVTLDLPVWSSEGFESDWMPAHPLSADVLGVDGGVMQGALDNYYASPTNDGLLEVIRQFRRVTTEKAHPEHSLLLCAAKGYFFAVANFPEYRWKSHRLQ